MSGPGHEQVFWEMWGLFNLLRELGFRSDDINAIMAKNANTEIPFYGKVCGFLRLNTQGRKVTISCFPTPEAMTQEQFKAGWAAFSEELATVPDALLKEKWEGSLAFREKALVIHTLVKKGFRFPKHERSH